MRRFVTVAGLALAACGHSAAAVSADAGAACACPEVAPANGAPCEQTTCGSRICAYDDCAGAGETVASCNMTDWSVVTSKCAAEACPGGSDLLCAPGELCVTRMAGDLAYACEANPCGTGPVTCECAAGVCQGGTCASTSGTAVACDECTGNAECP